jgi:hypothetical protein
MTPVRIGQQWKRRVECHDLWDHVLVVGRFEQQQSDEWVVQPVEGFAPNVSVTAADLAAAFSLDQEAPANQTPDLAAAGQAWL